MSKNMLAFTLAAAMIVFGTASTVLSKIQFNVESVGTETCDAFVPTPAPSFGADDDSAFNPLKCQFDKPYFSVLLMKFGMSLCMILHLWGKERKPADGDAGEGGAGAEDAYSSSKTPRAPLIDLEDGDESLLAGSEAGFGYGDQAAEPAEPEPTNGDIMMIALPAATDLFQTVLAMAGLLWVDSSIYQMARGSVVVFSAILSVTLLKKRMENRHLVAVAYVLVAILLVGVAGVEKANDQAAAADDDDGGGTSTFLYIIGLALIVFGQFVGAYQFILEEYLMTERGVSPTQLVAWEGIWGMGMMAVLYPILAATPQGDNATVNEASPIWHESFTDAWTQVMNSQELQVTCAITIFVLLTYNWVGNTITKHLNAVARAMLEACRTIGVWSVGLIVYYTTGNDTVGEQWTQWSFLELAAFFLLVWGTLGYKDIAPVDPRLFFKKKDARDGLSMHQSQ